MKTFSNYSRYDQIILALNTAEHALRSVSFSSAILTSSMDSDRTTPTRGSSITDSDPDCPEEEQNTTKTCGRKILFDDFEIFGQVIFSRKGVLVQAKKEDRLHSGTLQVSESKQGTFVTWERDTEPVNPDKTCERLGVSDAGEEGRKKVMINDQGNVAFCVGSPPSADWAVIADNIHQPTTPIGQLPSNYPPATQVITLNY